LPPDDTSILLFCNGLAIGAWNATQNEKCVSEIMNNVTLPESLRVGYFITSPHVIIETEKDKPAGQV